MDHASLHISLQKYLAYLGEENGRRAERFQDILKFCQDLRAESLDTYFNSKDILQPILKCKELFLQVLVQLSSQCDRTIIRGDKQTTSNIVESEDNKNQSLAYSGYVTCALHLLAAVNFVLDYSMNKLEAETGEFKDGKSIQGIFVREMVPWYYELALKIINQVVSDSADDDQETEYEPVLVDYPAVQGGITKYITLDFEAYSFGQQRSMLVSFLLKPLSKHGKFLAPFLVEDEENILRMATILKNIILFGGAKDDKHTRSSNVFDQSTDDSASHDNPFSPDYIFIEAQNWSLPERILEMSTRCLQLLIESCYTQVIKVMPNIGNDLIAMALESKRYALFYNFQSTPQLTKDCIPLIASSIKEIIKIPLSENVVDLSKKSVSVISYRSDWGISYMLKDFSKHLSKDRALCKSLESHSDLIFIVRYLAYRRLLYALILPLQSPELQKNYEDIVIDFATAFPYTAIPIVQNSIMKMIEVNEGKLEINEFMVQLIGIAGTATQPDNIAETMVKNLVTLLRTKPQDDQVVAIILSELQRLQFLLPSQTCILQNIVAIKRFHVMLPRQVKDVIRYAENWHSKSNTESSEKWMSLTKSLTFTKEDSAHNKPTIDDVLNAFNGLEHEVLEYLSSVENKFPTLVGLKISSGLSETFVLHFQCMVTKLELSYEVSEELFHWTRLIFLSLITGKLVIEFDDYPTPITNKFMGTHILCELFKACTSCTNDDFLSCISDPFVSSQDLATLLTILKSKGLLMKMTYGLHDSDLGWYIIEPHVDGIERMQTVLDDQAVTEQNKTSVEHYNAPTIDIVEMANTIIFKWKGLATTSAVVKDIVNLDCPSRSAILKQIRSDLYKDVPRNIASVNDLIFEKTFSGSTFQYAASAPPLVLASIQKTIAVDDWESAKTMNSQLLIALPSRSNPVALTSIGSKEVTPIALPKLAGFITKRGSIFHSWKRRFFTLENRMLAYYNTQSDIDQPSKRLGEFKLDSYVTIIQQSGMTIELRNPMAIRTRETLPLRFDNIELLRQWVSALELHCTSDWQLLEKAKQREMLKDASESFGKEY